MLIEWSDIRDPNEDCCYTHCEGLTIFGRFLLTWKGWKEDISNSLGFAELPWAGVYYGGWSNAAYDSLLNLAAQTSDPDTRESLYKQVEEILVETDAIMLPIYYYANGAATKPYLERSHNHGGFGGRIADWRITWRLFLPGVLRGA